MPPETSLGRSSRSQRSTSEPSVTGSTSPNSGMVTAQMGQPQSIRGQQGMPHTPGTMSIGSIIERSDYGSHHTRISNDLSHIAVGVEPRSLPAGLLYGIPQAAESPLYSSDSCYSPISDYLQQPQTSAQRYLPQDTVSRAQSSPLDSGYHQPQLITSSMNAAPAFPVWDQFDTPILGAQLEGSYLPTVGIPHL